MKVAELPRWLTERQVAPEFYAIEALGRGENVGIRSTTDSSWEVFFNERGSPSDIEKFDDEETAVRRFIDRLREQVRDYGGDF